MSPRLVVDSDNQLHQVSAPEYSVQSPVLRFAARLVSLIFHPVFVPVYLVMFLVNFQPMLFAGFNAFMKVRIVIMFFVIYSLFPLVTVLLCKGLGFLDSIYLKTQRDRIIPYIACEIYYFWIAYVLKNQPEIPHELTKLAIAIFLASTFGLLVNIVMKVSMHAISMGIMIAFMVLLATTQSSSFTIFLSIGLFIAGVVCTARLILADHDQKEVYTGLLLGIAAMVAGVWADKILP